LCLRVGVIGRCGAIGAIGASTIGGGGMSCDVGRNTQFSELVLVSKSKFRKLIVDIVGEVVLGFTRTEATLAFCEGE